MMGGASWNQVDHTWCGVHGHYQWRQSCTLVSICPSVRPSIHPWPSVSKSADGSQHLFQTFTKVNIPTVRAWICGWVALWFYPAWMKMKVFLGRTRRGWWLWNSSTNASSLEFLWFPPEHMSYCVSEWVKLNKTVIPADFQAVCAVQRIQGEDIGRLFGCSRLNFYKRSHERCSWIRYI